MNDTHDNLDPILDAWRVAPLDCDLAEAILTQAMAEDQSLDELLVRCAPAADLQRDLTGAILARARAEDDSLDRLLDSADAVPALSGDLSRPVMRAIWRGRLYRRVAALGGALAAAAAVLVVALILHTPAPVDKPAGLSGDQGVAARLFTPQERAILSHVDVDKLLNDNDLPVLVHWDTIQAMEELEEAVPETDHPQDSDTTG